MIAYKRWMRNRLVPSVPVGTRVSSSIDVNNALLNGTPDSSVTITLRRDLTGPLGTWIGSETFRISGSADEMEALSAKINESVRSLRKRLEEIVKDEDQS